LPEGRFDVWHDRAVFHFLADEGQRTRYVEAVRRSVRPGGHVIVAAFGPDGPTRCSGLPVVRYSPDRLHGEFGEAFVLVEHADEAHRTPFGTIQQFVYCYCRML
jgi:SAM-dependent methyltransferase